jgi:Spy/CpxP family protein refolding chaperone
MKHQLMSILTGAVVLTVTAIPLAQSVVHAAPGQQLLAQARTEGGQGRLGKLKLTKDQISQMRQIHQQTRQAIENVLDSKQREQYKAAMENRKNEMRSASVGTPNNSLQQRGGQPNILAELNLTPEQKTRIQEIMRASRNRLNAVLTEEQKRQIQQNMRSGRQNSPNNWQN